MTEPILTTVNTSYLECTTHSTKYHCLIRLRSSGGSPAIAETSTTPSTNDDVTITKGNTTTDDDDSVLKPDISSLVIVPIRERRSHNVEEEEERCVKRLSRTVNNVGGDYITNSSSSMNIPLFPKLYFDTHCTAAMKNDNNGGLLISNIFHTNGNDTTGTANSCIDDDAMN